MRPVAGPSGARGLIVVLVIYLFIESGLARPSDLVSNSTSNKIKVPSPTVEPMKDVSVATSRADDRANATSKRYYDLSTNRSKRETTNRSKRETRYSYNRGTVYMIWPQVMGRKMSESKTGWKHSNTIKNWKSRVKTVAEATPRNVTKKSPVKKIYTKWSEKSNLEDILNVQDTVASSSHSQITNMDKIHLEDVVYIRPKPGKINSVKYVKPTIATGITVVDGFNKHTTPVPMPSPIITYGGFVDEDSNEIIQNPLQNIFTPSHGHDSDRPDPSSSEEDNKIEIGGTDGCPTVYLTLNNTYSQGKGVCPDYNIVINSHLVNKNVIKEDPDIEETLEDDSDPNAYSSGLIGVPVGVSPTSIIGPGPGYNSALVPIAPAPFQPGGYGPAVPGGNSAVPGVGGAGPGGGPARPNRRPRPQQDSEDSSVGSWFNSAASVATWMTLLNPFGFGFWPLLVTPLVVLFAGGVGFATLIAPWAFPGILGRKQSKTILHVYEPPNKWKWDEGHKAWNWASFPNDRDWVDIDPRSDSAEVKNGPINKAKNAFVKGIEYVKKWLKRPRRNFEPSVRIPSIFDFWKKRRKSLKIEDIRKINHTIGPTSSKPGIVVAVSAPTTAPRVIKPATPIIRNSIQMVASQLLHSTTISTPSPTAPEIVEDVRTPPKMKHQLVTKNKPKKPEVKEELIENSHAGIAVPVSLDDIENEIKVKNVSSSTSKEGLSTWILLSNPTTISGVTENQKKDKNSVSTTTDSSDKKPPAKQQNKTNQKKTVTSTERPVTMKRPIITSVNKSDLVASGSAMTENTLNKIKATVYANVQKNKNASKIKTTTSPADVAETTENKAPPKKKNPVTTTQKTATQTTALTTDRTEENTISLEAKETEIELEVSTPATVTKKPKRTSVKRKKNKKRRKPSSASKIEESTKVNSTKVAKPSLKEKPITTQIYNYLSREIMPSVGVGIVGLAGLVGIASYFLYPFTGGALRRNDYINDRKDDLYRHNAEEYANDGNGQAEEEMLGTVLAGIPANSNNKANPYAAQTPQYQHPQQQNKNTEQNIRYRNVGYNSDISSNNYNPVSSQHKSGVAHGIVYPENIHYNTHREDNQKRYSTYQTDSVQTIFGKHSVESPTGYDLDPSYETSFSYDNVNIDTTRSPVSSSIHLGGEDVVEHQQETGYMISDSTRGDHPQFIVGNVPKEIIEVITPAAVPEHGPRNLRIRRSAQSSNSIPDTIEAILQKSKENKRNEISNEIDDALGISNSIFGDDEDSLKVLTLKPEPEFDNELFYKVFEKAPVPTTKKPIYVYPVNTKTTTPASTTTVELKTETDPLLFLTTKNYDNSGTTVTETDTTTHGFAGTQWHTSNIDTTYIPTEATSIELSTTETKDLNTQTDTTKNTSNQPSTMDLTTEITSIKNKPDSTVYLDASTESSTHPSRTETETMSTHEDLENHSTNAALSTHEYVENSSTNAAFVSTVDIATSTELETDPSSTEFKELTSLWDSQSQYTDHVYLTTVNLHSTETGTETGRDLKETKPFTEYTTTSPTVMDLSVEPMYVTQINKNEKGPTVLGVVDNVKDVVTDVPSTTQDNYLFNEIDVAFNDLTTKKENIEITILVEVTTPRVSSTTENEIKILTDDFDESTVKPIKRDEIPTILTPVNGDIPDRYPPPPPPKTFSLFSFLKRLVEFKYRLGLSILQSTSETLARYLRGAEKTLRAAAKASGYMQVPQE